MSVVEALIALEQSLGLNVRHASFAPLFAGFVFAAYRATQSNAPTFATVRPTLSSFHFRFVVVVNVAFSACFVLCCLFLLWFAGRRCQIACRRCAVTSRQSAATSVRRLSWKRLRISLT